MDISVEQLLQIVEKSSDVHLHIRFEGELSNSSNGDSNSDNEDDVPDTLLIRMIEREAFKKPSSYNKVGKPIMDKTIPGFRAEVGDIFQVYIDQVIADGGGRYWRIWRGEESDISMRDWHVSVSRTVKI